MPRLPLRRRLLRLLRFFSLLALRLRLRLRLRLELVLRLRLRFFEEASVVEAAAASAGVSVLPALIFASRAAIAAAATLLSNAGAGAGVGAGAAATGAALFVGETVTTTAVAALSTAGCDAMNCSMETGCEALAEGGVGSVDPSRPSTRTNPSALFSSSVWTLERGFSFMVITGPELEEEEEAKNELAEDCC